MIVEGAALGGDRAGKSVGRPFTPGAGSGTVDSGMVLGNEVGAAGMAGAAKGFCGTTG